MSARLALAIAGTGLAMLAGSATSQAAFPGPNGQIVYMTGNGGLRTVSPDGTGDRMIVFGSARDPQWSPDGRWIAHHTSNPTNIYVVQADGSASTAVIGDARAAAWSPDGEKIAFTRAVGSLVRLFIANADGSGDAEIPGLPAGDIANPAWSPDGTKIAFSETTNLGGPVQYDLYTVNPDGTGVAMVASGSLHEDLPSWSPDGSKIAFTRLSTLDNSTVWTMNADGSGQVQIASCCASSPAWSPDGTKIVFRDDYFDPNLWVMDTDGSNRTPLSIGGNSPDWQPNLWPGHARPKGATPMRVALVPTYHGCAASNEQHGPPLSFPSCSPPLPQSTTLTVGTPDANGFGANSDSSAKVTVVTGDPGTPGDQADVTLTASTTDVRCRAANAACPGGAGSDYAGALMLVASFRITDKLNGPSDTESATVSSQSLLRTSFSCVPTGDPATGADCALATTADALVPGTVNEGKRAVWELGEVQVYDSGPNGTGYASCPPTCGNGDETMFMRQGLFVP